MIRIIENEEAQHKEEMEAKCLEIVEAEDKYESLQKDFSTAVEQHAELLS
jgi:hypothetical protein